MWVDTGTDFFDRGRILISCICETNKRDRSWSQPPQVKYGCFRKCFELSHFQWKLLWSSERLCLRISLPGLHVSWTKKMVFLRDFFSPVTERERFTVKLCPVNLPLWNYATEPTTLLPFPSHFFSNLPQGLWIRRLIPERNMITQSSFSRASRKLPTLGAEVNWPRNRQAVDKEGRRKRVWTHSKQEMKASMRGANVKTGDWKEHEAKKVTAVSGRREPLTRTHENDFSEKLHRAACATQQ